MSHFMYCLLMITVKNQSQFGQSISSFRICYGLLGFELPLAKCQPLKILDFGIFLNYFLKELKTIFQVHLNILPKLGLVFCCYQQRIWKIRHFWHSKDHNFESKHDKYTNDCIFLIYFLGSVRWPISFLHFKTLKIQFHGVPLLHYVLVCKIHIYMPNKTLSNQLT